MSKILFHYFIDVLELDFEKGRSGERKTAWGKREGKKNRF